MLSARLHAEGITHIGGASNSHVLRLMGEHDYLAFPTFHDTFGYVAVEALACGTPVVASRTCALPEIVGDGAAGSMLQMVNEPVVGKWVVLADRWQHDYDERYLRQLERFASELADVLEAFWETRRDYESRSAAALEGSRSHFDRGRARERLERLYDESVRTT